MRTPPLASAATPSARDQALYRNLVQEASAGGTVLMGKLVAAARQALQTQEAGMRDMRERDVLADAANQLRRHEQQLCRRYPEALLQAFTHPDGGHKAPKLSLTDVQFDQLELMDEAQVLSSVTLARIQQVSMQVAEASLAELNTLMCSVLGMQSVRADVNPLRPEAYVNALKEVAAETQVSPTMQLLWFNAMCTAMSQELRALYSALCTRLRKEGVMAVAYAVPSGPGAQRAVGVGTPAALVHRPDAVATVPGEVAPAGPSGAGGSQGAPTPRGAMAPAAYAPAAPAGAGAAMVAPMPVHGRDEVLLTLDKLRRLLSGELHSDAPTAQGSPKQQFAAQFAQQFEGHAGVPQQPPSEFDGTVPAALQALTEMKQVNRVVENLEQRRSGSQGPQAPDPHTVEGQRLALRQNADMAQALSLEVVTLMVDNMARDPRLLEPVRRVIRNLEPALLRLALVDPRFFTDKQHPARRLLQELTHQSMAFESATAPGFEAFLSELQAALAPLFQAPIEGAEVFEAKLRGLQQQWSQAARGNEKDREAAVEVLQHAEARNLLAEKIAMSIENHKDSAKVPPLVIEFLCGPWAQVVAQARIKQGAGSAQAEKYEALIPALLWSAHPELARASPSKLTRVVPRVLTTLREGLDTIRYPGTRTSSFLEALMAIHQQIFRAAGAKPGLDASLMAPEKPATERLRPVADGDPWMAPEEAAISNFVDLADGPQAVPVAVPATVPVTVPVAGPAATEGAPDPVAEPPPDLPAPVLGAAAQVSDFPLGSWVQLWVNDQWLRTQLTWASPHGTLFLFTSVVGTSQSMTRRSRDKLLASGKLRLLSGQSVDQGALDVVAQIAMRNSLDGSAL